MKRFYCTVCKRVKRVRKYPLSVTEQASDVVALRRGVCSWHSSPSVFRGVSEEKFIMKGGK